MSGNRRLGRRRTLPGTVARARPSGSGSPAPRSRLRAALRRDEGNTMILFAIALPTLIAVVALAIDVGHAYALKRHLQNAADAAAVAGAWRLDAGKAAAEAEAMAYSASVGGRNRNAKLPSVTTDIDTWPSSPPLAKIKVTQSAKSSVFFGGILGFDGFDVSATAVASRMSATEITGGVQYAIFVHGLCAGGSPGYNNDQGLSIEGDNAVVDGAIHMNGNLKVGNPGFKTNYITTVWRPNPANAESPPEPGKTQGSCKGSSPLFVEQDKPATYCAIGCAPGETAPRRGPYRDWITPYHTAAIVRERVSAAAGLAPGACTHTPSGDVTLSAGVISDARFYCLASGKLFKIDGAVRGPTVDGVVTHARITVIADKIEVGGSGAKIRPFIDAEPVLFYKTGASDFVNVNPSGAMDWVGYVINRFGLVQVNSGGVVSPREGLIEAEAVKINGPNFTMLGRGPVVPDTGTPTTTFQDPVLDDDWPG